MDLSHVCFDLIWTILKNEPYFELNKSPPFPIAYLVKMLNLLQPQEAGGEANATKKPPFLFDT